MIEHKNFLSKKECDFFIEFHDLHYGKAPGSRLSGNLKIIEMLQRKPYSRQQIKIQLGLKRPQVQKVVINKDYKHTATNYSYGAGEGDRHE